MTDDATPRPTTPHSTSASSFSAYDGGSSDMSPCGPTLEALADAGFDIAALSEEQHEVLGALTQEELALLVDIRGRLDAAAPEVQAHADVAGGALF